MRIADAAQRLSISAGWLRQLERAGRIPRAARDRNGHRRFSEEDVARLRVAIYGTVGNAELRAWADANGVRWPDGEGKASA
jgi:DNA-binding transcriptional MerR regulator